MDSDLVIALRLRGVTVLTALESALIETSDEEHLRFAATQGCALYTFNVGDFFRLHTAWAIEGRSHSGIILSPQQRFSTGEQVRRLLRLRSPIGEAAMRNRVEFLGNWG